MLRENLERVESRILTACERSNRARSDVLLLPVSKTHPIERIAQAYELGLRDFGENRVQELLPKHDSLPQDIRWHLIGHLQSNKVKPIAPFVAMVHSIDSLETAKSLSKHAAEAERTIAILIEVNVSNETSKHGVRPEDAEQLLEGILTNCPDLIPRGLMSVASYEENVERTRPQFALLRERLEKLRCQFPELRQFDQLSIGMTNDFEVAIEEGATIVRIGSALFGDRVL